MRAGARVVLLRPHLSSPESSVLLEWGAAIPWAILLLQLPSAGKSLTVPPLTQGDLT